MFSNFVIVGIGGAVGSMLRHAIGLVWLKSGAIDFPWPTFLINILGSFLIGLVVAMLAYLQNWSEEVRLFTIVGLLGGFTTFSAFSLETVLLFERGQYFYTSLYIIGSVLLSIAATYLGLFLVRAFLYE